MRYRPLQADIEMRDLAFGQGEDLYLGIGHAFEQAGNILLVAAPRVAGQSYWRAGLEMMMIHNGNRFNDFVYADGLVQANADAVAVSSENAVVKEKAILHNQCDRAATDAIKVFCNCNSPDGADRDIVRYNYQSEMI